MKFKVFIHLFCFTNIYEFRSKRANSSTKNFSHTMFIIFFFPLSKIFPNSTESGIYWVKFVCRVICMCSPQRFGAKMFILFFYEICINLIRTFSNGCLWFSFQKRVFFRINSSNFILKVAAFVKSWFLRFYLNFVILYNFNKRCLVF